jgi:inner membrane protein
MEWINNNLLEVLVFLGLGLLAVEVLIFGLGTFVLFFIGLAAVLTGLLMYLNIIPENAVNGLVSVAVLTCALALGLWKPLKKMQNNVEHKTPQSDLIGHSFVLEGDISSTQNIIHSYSGIDWKVKSEAALAAGTEVEVVKTEVGEFTVAAKTS